MLPKVAIVLNVVSLVLSVVAVIIPTWFYWSTSVDGLEAYIKIGLWEWCREIPKVDTGCSRLEEFVPPVSGQIKAARGLVLLSIPPTLMAAVIAFMYTIRIRGGRLLLVTAGVLSGIAGLLCIIGTILFVIENQIKNMLEKSINQTDLKPHAGFALCVTSGLLNLTGALLYAIDAFCTKRNRISNVETSTESHENH